MENKDLEKLTWKMSSMLRQFDYNQQGYSLIKCMVLRYALMAIDKDYFSYKDFYGRIGDYFWNLKTCVESNMQEIKAVLGENFEGLMLDCIVSFSAYSEKGTGFDQAILMMEELSFEGLQNFIVNGFNNIMHRYNYGTPASLSKLIFGLFGNPQNATILDLACGDGDFLVSNAIQNRNNKYLGCEINFDASLLAKIRLTFLGVTNCIQEENVLNSTYVNHADYVFVEPPFGLKMRNSFNSEEEIVQIYNRDFKFGQTAEWLFIDKALQGLNDNGKAIVVVPEGLLTSQLDINQRQYLINNNFIEGVIKLPQNFFQYASIPTSVIILSKNKISDDCKFVDASEMYNVDGRSKILDVETILDCYNNKATIVNLAEFSNNDYNLSVNRYKDVTDLKLDNPLPLSDLVEDVFRGVQISADILHKYSTSETSEDCYKIVSAGDIVDGTFEISALEKIKIEKNYDRYLLQNNDVLISCKSTKVKTSIVEIKDDEKVIPSGSIIVIRCDETKLNPVYLKMFLDSNIGTKLLASVQTGTVIISINPKSLYNLIISCLPIEKQKELANIYLGTLDMLKLEKKKLEKLEHKLNNIYNEIVGD